MNRFNKKARNNVKAKRMQKRESRRDKAAARQAAQAAKEAVAPLPKARSERLAVSGRRTGKFKRKIVRKLQKAEAAGAVTMEDIVMYAAGSSGTTRQAKCPPESGTVGMEVKQPSIASKSSLGFRVKPSKKARLRLKLRGGRVASVGPSGSDMMEQ